MVICRKLVSRAEAKTKGHDKYYSGLTCKNGHKSQRYVTTNQCVTCITGTPIISEFLLNFAIASAKIQGVNPKTFPNEPRPPIKLNKT